MAEKEPDSGRLPEASRSAAIRVRDMLTTIGVRQLQVTSSTPESRPTIGVQQLEVDPNTPESRPTISVQLQVNPNVLESVQRDRLNEDGTRFAKMLTELSTDATGQDKVDVREQQHPVLSKANLDTS